MPSHRFHRGGAPLQVLRNPDGAPPARAVATAHQARLSLVGGRPRLVLCGGGAAQRAAVREQLIASVPGALVLEATDVWEVMQLAPRSNLVVLAGDLPDGAADAVVRLLAHRHPELAVISLAGGGAEPTEAR